MALLRCAVCFRNPPEGQEPWDATQQIYWLGFAKLDSKGKRRREVIHLPCGRRFWTNHPRVLELDLYSLKDRRIVAKGTRLDQ